MNSFVCHLGVGVLMIICCFAINLPVFKQAIISNFFDRADDKDNTERI